MVPKAGEWYAVTTRPFLFAFGMGNLVEYRVKDFAKQTFFLGLFGQATCSVVHLRGFQRWMRGQVCVTRESLARALYDVLCRTVRPGVSEILHDIPEYSACICQKKQLEKVIEKALFPLLYDNGICMKSQSYRILNFSKPTIGTHNLGG